MVNDTWTVYWEEFMSDSYGYGSEVEFNKDKSVRYSNRLMPPGTVVHRWYSKTNYQMHRLEPTLPLA